MLAQVAELLGAGPGASRVAPRRSASGSGAPDGREPGRVESVVAASGWVDDQVRLNLRTGPGNQFRILGSVETGDSVEILTHGDGWIEVRADGKSGWVPDGYLKSEPPAGFCCQIQPRRSPVRGKS